MPSLDFDKHKIIKQHSQNKLTLIAGQSENLTFQNKADLDLRWLESFFFSVITPAIAAGLYGSLKITVVATQ